MKPKPMDIVILGLSITSSWGNGHATTYRALARALHARGHRVLFLERDVAWYADNRDLATPRFARIELYKNLSDLRRRFSFAVRAAELVIVGSYVPDGIEVGRWVTRLALGVTAFYDIDTPVTIANLERGEATYISHELIRSYDMYLSFTGGPLLDRIAERYGARQAWPLHCSVDPDQYFPEPHEARWDLGYMGTYSEDRQPMLDRLMLSPARSWRRGRFVVAGPQYPARTRWPRNVGRITHLPPARHRRFYNSQRFTLNITRQDMVAAGYSPSVRLFEAAACATPIITDAWPGLETFFRPGVELVVSTSASETLRALLEMTEPERLRMGAQARARVLAAHTALHRAAELERYVRGAEAGATELESVRSGGTWLKR
jgi:spore maturation protein CgeB